ncbi:probable WRKY transcription factor 63 [Brassica rapa]|uniref:WRKY transcription factor 64 n=1 Tax=Brassica campestris TaxID=3711 RepID=V5RF92_BRACM|nr:probable WRKY transcription factor 63 [Brassica rapa]AHB33859.1 WRKY transcription factor 64 [Brassica rapa]
MFHGADKAVEALLRGQESANLLKTVLEHRRTSSVSIEPLFDTLLDSFSFAISLFASSNTQPHRDSSQCKATPGTARKSSKNNSNEEECLEQYSHDSPTPLQNDGFSWRKYGQKKIKASSHQRCYYRCAYAKDRNCNAKKREQQIQDSPSVYRTTYVGKHICDVNVFSEPDDDIANGSKMIRFDKMDQAMPDSVMPQLAPVEKQAAIAIEEDSDQIMNLEFDINEFLVDDDQLWAYQFPPFSPGFLDDLSEFDHNPFLV